MSRAQQLISEINSLIAARSALLSNVHRAASEREPQHERAAAYKALTESQLLLEADLDTYDERSRFHPDRKLP